MAKPRFLFQLVALLMACCLSATADARPRAETGSGGQAAYTFRDCAECPEMVVIPAGSFVMDEPGAQRKITISRAFAAGKYEVTFGEWDACVAAGGCGGYRPPDEGWGRGRRPVMNISYDDARQYLQWLSQKTGKTYRLLSEAEWEYAARAGITPAYPRGKAAGSASANCDECGSQWSNTQTAPVGSLKPNALGMYDMHGNVWEWVEGCFGCNCEARIQRGAALGSGSEAARAARRIRSSTGDRNGNAGFRVAAYQNIAGDAADGQPPGVIDLRGLLECSKQVMVCPQVVTEVIKTISSDKPVTIEGANFDTDSAKLKPEADARLDEVVAFAAKYPGSKLEVTGHTDSSGSVAWNEKLSAARAESVKAYLIGKGMAAERINTRGVASAQPVADNNSVEGRAQNRRVEIGSAIKEVQKIREQVNVASPCNEPAK